MPPANFKTDHSGPEHDPALAALLQAWMTAGSLDRMKAILKEHPELFSTEADLLLTRAGDERTRKALDDHRELLKLCKKIGIDAAFAEVERHKQSARDAPQVVNAFFQALSVKSETDLVQLIRDNPRMVEAESRNLFRSFVAQQGTFATQMPRIDFLLRFLEQCEKDGLETALLKFKSAPQSTPPGQVSPAAGFDSAGLFNALVKKFNDGRHPEVVQEALALASKVQNPLGAGCLLLALISSCKTGNHRLGSRLALVLHQNFKGWDLPGLPERAHGLAVVESKDTGPILDVLDSLQQRGDCTPEERDALNALIANYTERKHHFQSGH